MNVTDAVQCRVTNLESEPSSRECVHQPLTGVCALHDGLSQRFLTVTKKHRCFTRNTRKDSLVSKHVDVVLVAVVNDEGKDVRLLNNQ
jgi:hypothetical protein